MRKTIFNLDNKINIKDEYVKIIKVLSNKCVLYKKRSYSYFDFVNTFIFNNWEYRSTFIDLYDYLKHLGVNLKSKKISNNSFLNLLEFLLNIEYFIENNKYYSDNVTINTQCRSIVQHNIYLILESLDYESYRLDDKIIICKKNLDFNNLEEILPDDIYELLLSYNNINNSGIKTKRIILNKLYNYISKDQDKYKSLNSSIYSSIKLIINKMGVIGEIDSKYKNLTNYKLRKYYDYCFRLICFIINTEYIMKIKEEIKKVQ